MTTVTDETLDRVFYALSDPSRRRMLLRIASADCLVRELANSFSFTKAATSKHLGVLEKACLIEKTRKGRDVLCSINPLTLQSAEDWLQFYRQFWDKRLNALEKFVSTRPSK